MRTGLPKRVYLKHGRYWYVAPSGKTMCRATPAPLKKGLQ